MNELQIIRRIRRLAATQAGNRSLIKGIGDDAAIFRADGKSDLVFTTDFVIEGRHFSAYPHRPVDIGYRALARSLSDLAAMGADPLFCLVSIAVPPALATRWLGAFYKALLNLANEHNVTLAGGDLSTFEKVVVDVMCCGRIPKGKAILRSGARPGDLIYVTGELGGAASSNWLRRPLPRIEAGRALRGRVSAGMDISDGLSLDLHRLCLESEVRADIAAACIPIARGATLEQALHGGEDYELLFTAPPGTKLPKISATRIGIITRGKPGQVRLDGKPLRPKGFDPFVGSRSRGHVAAGA